MHSRGDLATEAIVIALIGLSLIGIERGSRGRQRSCPVRHKIIWSMPRRNKSSN
jgi:hypothetical protein